MDSRDLIACPHCDALYRRPAPRDGERAVCVRCHTVLARPRAQAGVVVIALAFAAAVLIVAAVFAPFIEIRLVGNIQATTIYETATAFSGPMLVLSLTLVGFIILIPLARLCLTLYVMVPLVAGRPPARHAARAFRLADELRPWAMAEIFVIGCAVALVKVADLATLTYGPAFWMFVALVVIVLIHDAWLCRNTVWTALERR